MISVRPDNNMADPAAGMPVSESVEGFSESLFEILCGAAGLYS